MAVLLAAVAMVLPAKNKGVSQQENVSASRSEIRVGEPDETLPTDKKNASEAVEEKKPPESEAATENKDASAPAVSDKGSLPEPERKVTPAKVKKATFIGLGADECVPCKMMAPIRAELEQSYPDTLKVVFHDVWKDPSRGEKYEVRSIPTSIILDGDGKELYRHVGFWPKEDILAKFKELGIAL